MTYDRFKDLTFEGFKKLAQDASLSRYGKIGFPDSYRDGKEEYIFEDILSKLPALTKKNKTIVDVGIGCSGLAFMLIDLCIKRDHQLMAVDSAEMLNLLPNDPHILKFPGYYPRDCVKIFEDYVGKIDAILVYSVIQYVFVEASLFGFIDKSLSLLSEGGFMLIGDVPNISKRKRFFSSNNGAIHHQEYTGTDELPVVQYNVLEEDKIDDAVVMSLLMRCRAAGFDAYIVPQPDNLPMANRREDILIRRP